MHMAQTPSRKQKLLGEMRRAHRRRALIGTAIIAIMMTGIVVAVILLSKPPQVLIGQPISADEYARLADVTVSTLNRVGAGQGVTPLATINDSPLMSGGKSEFLYVGAEYCPFCAAERWSIIVALSKFGSFSGLTYMQSSPTDVYPNTATFSFLHATYQSQYNISFVSVERQDRYNNSLQQVSLDQQNLLNRYDPGGHIPFIDIAGRYAIQPQPIQPSVYAGSQYSPGVISSLDWTQIGSQLNTPGSNVAEAIDGTANTLIRAICQLDGGNPSSTCSAIMAPDQLPFPVLNATADNLEWMITSDHYGDSGYSHVVLD